MAADVAALIAFVLVGSVKHGEGLNLRVLLHTGLPLVLAWVLVALLAGTYRRPGWVTLLLTWALAVPLALIVRSVIRGGPWRNELLIFGGVAMAFTLLFLVAGRAIVWLVRRRSG